MSPIQQMLLGVGAGATKTYVDDIFSTYLWKGTGSSLSINNGINFSGEGGMTWVKCRSTSTQHSLFDTVRGVDKVIFSEANEDQAEYNYNQTFTSTGFTFNNSFTDINDSSNTYSSWTFRKSPGFFDVVTYTGNNTSGRQISHDLGSIPGMIFIKKLSSASNWIVYHRSTDSTAPEDYILLLNGTNERISADQYHAKPTASHFTLSGASDVNAGSATYVAYVFAGGEEGYNSVEFDGTGDYLSIPSSSDVAYGTGDFTIEAWLKPTSTPTQVFLDHGLDDPMIGILGSKWQYYNSTVSWKYAGTPTAGVWTHFAVARESGTTRMFINGSLITSFSDSHNYGNNATSIGAYNNGSYRWTGSISNVRIVKGTAVYTSAFTPSTTPLTNITNTKLLCCNGDLATSSTVTPGTITANGDPHTTGTSPFTSPSAVFGENEDQGVIKCGSYIGNGSSTAGPEIFLGWEPQWVLIKWTAEVSGNVEGWVIVDAMRGIVTGGNDNYFLADDDGEESTSADVMDLTPTGFKIKNQSDFVNNNGTSYIFTAIRRSDGYVGKPPSLGTGVFSMVAGTSNSDIPAFVSGFPLDYVFIKKPLASGDWYTQSRLTGTNGLKINEDSNQSTDGDNTWDFQNGYYKGTSDLSSYQAWMFKRHAGFDVVTFKGDGVAGRQMPHNLSKTPEMIWVKRRTSGTARDWMVYHKGLNGGTNPEQYGLVLNTSAAEVDQADLWNDTAHSSTYFTLGGAPATNSETIDYIAMLFASVDGISKVGYYAGSDSEQTITTGFQPRFVIIKNISTSSAWFTLDTVRGWGSGEDKWLRLDSTTAQNPHDFGTPISTGFTMPGDDDSFNDAGSNFIYYAHA